MKEMNIKTVTDQGKRLNSKMNKYCEEDFTQLKQNTVWRKG